LLSINYILVVNLFISTILGLIASTIKKDINHGGDNCGGTIDFTESVFFIFLSTLHRWIVTLNVFRLAPLGKNEDVHPTEKSKEKEESWDNFEEEIQLIAEVDTIETLQDYTN